MSPLHRDLNNSAMLCAGMALGGYGIVKSTIVFAGMVLVYWSYDRLFRREA